jgi:hypothetical protein
MQGGPVHPGREARGAVPHRPAMAGRARLPLDPRLPPGGFDQGHRRDGPAPPSQPGRHDLGGHGPAEACQRLHGPHAGDVLRAAVPKGRSPFRLTRQGAGRPPQDHRGRRPPLNPVHHGDPGRHRGEPAGAGRVPLRHPLAAPEVSAHPGGHSPELQGQAGNGHAAGPRALRGGVPGHGSRGSGRVRPVRERPGPTQPFGPALPAPDRRRDQRLGRRLAGDDRPCEPGGSMAEVR